MINDKPNHKSVILAAITASILMFSFGLVRWVLAAKLENPVTSTPVAHDLLDGLPMQVGNWTGVDISLDDTIVRRTDSDTLINRRYSSGNGLGSITLYICCGVDTRQLMVHRPDVCYPAAGWTLVNRRSVELSLDDMDKLPCSIYHFSRGDLNEEKVTVLHYFITDGQYHDTVSVLRQRLWKLFSSVPWVAQVQIVSPVNISMKETAEKLVSSFAVDSANSIAELFESMQKDQTAQATGAQKKGDILN